MGDGTDVGRRAPLCEARLAPHACDYAPVVPRMPPTTDDLEAADDELWAALLHNDADGHVPWYQGIEMYMALRRLNKPAWMLNYNGEPHWPVKRENRIDFQIRMGQFFDHYLKGAPMPEWMRKGIPAVEKGINKGYSTK